jgi:hypothetical protein
VSRRSENRAACLGSELALGKTARTWGRATLLAALAFGALWSADARAQTITIGTNVGRRLPDAKVGSDYNYRTARRWWINYDECQADEYFDFYLSLSEPRDRLEVWAGSENCAEKRNLQDHGQCWMVEANDRPTDNFTISVPVRNVVANRVGASSAEVPTGLDEDICAESTDVDGLQLKLYFFLQNGGQVVGTPQTWDAAAAGGVGFDLVGPEPPGSINIGMGENQLSVNLEDVQEESDRERFAAYCAPGVVDDTFIPAEGAAVACSTTELTVGARPSPGLKCGEASETSGSIITDINLQNDQLYAVGVSGQDVVGNAGPLSALACGTPKQLDDFFELYSGAGGPGGGGFCSIRPGASSSAPGAALLLGLALAALRARRARSMT